MYQKAESLFLQLYEILTPEQKNKSDINEARRTVLKKVKRNGKEIRLGLARVLHLIAKYGEGKMEVMLVPVFHNE